MADVPELQVESASFWCKHPAGCSKLGLGPSRLCEDHVEIQCGMSGRGEGNLNVSESSREDDDIHQGSRKRKRDGPFAVEDHAHGGWKNTETGYREEMESQVVNQRLEPPLAATVAGCTEWLRVEGDGAGTVAGCTEWLGVEEDGDNGEPLTQSAVGVGESLPGSLTSMMVEGRNVNPNLWLPHSVPNMNLHALSNPNLIGGDLMSITPGDYCQFPGGCLRSVKRPARMCKEHGGMICQYSDCSRKARGTTGLCTAHGGGKRCSVEGCQRSAERKEGLCDVHGGGKRCQADGCDRTIRLSTKFCTAHGGGKRCKYDGCPHIARGRTDYCKGHGGGRRCQQDGCNKSAEGGTMRCKAHGGGRRCTHEGCDKSAEGATKLCARHGGGRRCKYEGCPRVGIGKSSLCVTHGGGKRCQVEDCASSARGATPFCIKHGGGKRCRFDGCKYSAAGATDFCFTHGGGRKCSAAGCGRRARGKSNLCVKHTSCPPHMLLHQHEQDDDEGDKYIMAADGGLSDGQQPLSAVSDHSQVPYDGNSGATLGGGGEASSSAKRLYYGRHKRCLEPGCPHYARHVRRSDGTKTGYCISHGGGRHCQHQGCGRSIDRGTLCSKHGGLSCMNEGCTRLPVGRSKLCITHGGGARCESGNCKNLRAAGRSGMCIKHGGGRRCEVPSCTTAARGMTKRCAAHGGGAMCVHPDGCSTAARLVNGFCRKHGGGRRCACPGCPARAITKRFYCVPHEQEAHALRAVSGSLAGPERGEEEEEEAGQFMLMGHHGDEDPDILSAGIPMPEEGVVNIDMGMEDHGHDGMVELSLPPCLASGGVGIAAGGVPEFESGFVTILEPADGEIEEVCLDGGSGSGHADCV